MRKVTIDDIPELRAYNATREELRRSVIALKARRRVHVGPVVTMVFENFETVRWQVCEMVRAERIATEEGVRKELEVYNALVPDSDGLSATAFLELTSDAALREWLPKLVGIHDAFVFELVDGSTVLGFDPEAQRLTRDEITAAVHFIKFQFTPEQVATFVAGPVRLAVEHPQYRESVELDAVQHAELSADLTSPL